ncbi:hypothetical protein ARMGADRAFT_239287 [Armillaria gallica]|uniref:PX domain-containing protein n=1 Tax=Armillaria gallica TaxID=47427 RepID=A0A2H3EEY1_ARMGA|nr:hypothetical protein ARMGADRAFT_239287 [Armillaria gallica]
MSTYLIQVTIAPDRATPKKSGKNRAPLRYKQFAELYPTLKETVPEEDVPYIEVASIVLLHTDPPLRPLRRPLRSALAEYLDSLREEEELSQDLENCTISTSESAGENI